MEEDEALVVAASTPNQTSEGGGYDQSSNLLVSKAPLKGNVYFKIDFRSPHNFIFS